MSQKQSSSLAVVVFQLGGPDSLAAVEPFLFNLFSDPDIIDFPFARLARPALARLVSSRRARHVQEHYASIGGKSPIRELTERQARALERELRTTYGLAARVFVAMRYWHPLTAQAVDQIVRGDFREVILLPLYPHYSKTTTGSSLNEWRRQYARAAKDSLRTHVVRSFHNHPAYLDALIERINEGLARFAHALPPTPEPHSEPATTPSPTERAQGDKDWSFQSRPRPAPIEDVQFVFSAHGVPVRVIEAGDPYQKQIEETVRLVMERGGWRNPHVLCYQSRVNPGKWLEPSLSETLRSLAKDNPREVLKGLPEAQERLTPRRKHAKSKEEFHATSLRAFAPLREAGDSSKSSIHPDAVHAHASGGASRGAKRVLVIPISFVTDHVETLAEINIEARALAAQLGIEQFELMPALNDSPTFIRALAELVLTAVGSQASAAHSKNALTAEVQSAQR
jgi:ferrochelatase